MIKTYKSRNPKKKKKQQKESKRERRRRQGKSEKYSQRWQFAKWSYTNFI